MISTLTRGGPPNTYFPLAMTVVALVTTVARTSADLTWISWLRFANVRGKVTVVIFQCKTVFILMAILFIFHWIFRVPVDRYFRHIGVVQRTRDAFLVGRILCRAYFIVYCNFFFDFPFQQAGAGRNDIAIVDT